MFKKYTKPLIIFILLSFTMMLSGCFNDSRPAKISCTETCLQLSDNGKSIRFNSEYLFVENSYKFVLETDKEVSKVEIESLNMNMGTIPVILKLETKNENNYIYSGTVFFGMCSEPHMRWQINIDQHTVNAAAIPISVYWNEKYIIN